MPKLVHRITKEVSILDFSFHKKDIFDWSKFKIVYDSEFTVKVKLLVDSIQLYIPIISKDYCIVYEYSELTNDFNPWFQPLIDLGYSLKPLGDEELNQLLNEVQYIYDYLTDGIYNATELKKVVNQAINDGLWDEILSSYSLHRECLKYKRSKGQSEIEIQLPKVVIELEAFFAEADLFKVIGKNWQTYILEAELESRRVIKPRQYSINKTNKKTGETSTAVVRTFINLPPTYFEGVLHEVKIVLRDAMNRFPVLSGKGLDNQCQVYKTDFQKLDIETDELAASLGLKSQQDIKRNMSLFRELEPILFAQYSAGDCFATDSLSNKQQELLDGIKKDFDLKLSDVKDTTGSNVSSFIYDLILKHFNGSDSDTISLIKSKVRQSNADNFQKIELNQFGVQTTRTVGGLLYSRVARCPVLKGYFGDLDECSCYATKLSSINIYLGQHIVSTFKLKKYKPKLKEVLEFLSNNCPRDGWMIRVSGKLEKALNTIALSDLSFQPKKIKFKTIFDIDPGRKSIGQFNAYKTSNKEAASTILLKEIKFGLITADIWDSILCLPENWIEEYFNLSVDALVFIPNELICESLEDLQSKLDYYPDDERTEEFDPKTGLMGIKAQYSKKNLCLKFPIKDYFQLLKAKRSEYKKANNPIQEVYKLFLNSGYGALACEHLPVNNLLAANIITGGARATSWLMVNALNGFQVITDGSTFSWEHIPIGLKFRDILETNPWYLVDFDPTIKSNINQDEFNQSWINEQFKQHLYDFYNVDQNHIPSNLYDFELKEEKFLDESGQEVKTSLYTSFYNTGSGNYSKGMHGQHILIDGSEYTFFDQYKPVKARSFKGKNKDLLKWYLSSLENGYESPRIDAEDEVIKFGDGNVLAIKFLESGIDEIAHPMGFSTKKYKLMKLITRSQFLFLNEKQLRNFETTNQLGKLDSLSKNWLTPKYWNKLTLDKLQPYGVSELIQNCDYYQYAKDRPSGIGFELLALNRSHKGSIESVRNLIADKIKTNCTNFNAALNIDKNIELSNKFTNIFAALTVLRANAEIRLRDILINSANEPTILAISRESVTNLNELMDWQE
jgi:hypothetical protein